MENVEGDGGPLRAWIAVGGGWGGVDFEEGCAVAVAEGAHGIVGVGGELACSAGNGVHGVRAEEGGVRGEGVREGDDGVEGEGAFLEGFVEGSAVVRAALDVPATPVSASAFRGSVGGRGGGVVDGVDQVDGPAGKVLAAHQDRAAAAFANDESAEVRKSEDLVHG